MGAIYKITNNVNQKIYIGKTTRDPKIRWAEHIQYSNMPSRYNTPLYQAIRKYGLENFSFEVLVDNITSQETLNILEQNFIQKYHATSHENGYNIALGGDGGRTSSKLTPEQAEKIRQILADENNLQSFPEIGASFNISNSVVQQINQGNTWFSSNYNYPIRKYDVTGLTISRDKYKAIINEIQNTTKSLAEIATAFQISERQITAINQGQYCYTNENQYYKGIYLGNYPIRKSAKTITPNDAFIPIFYDVLFTKDSMAKIGARYGVEGNTIQCIVTGRRRKELTKDFLVPMRKNLEENQKIFLSLYPNYKGVDAQ